MRFLFRLTVLLLLLGSLVTAGLFGSKDNSGALSDKVLRELEKSRRGDKYTQAIQNAVSNNPIRKLALNRELQGQIDEHFAYRIDTPGPITDQRSSGRCWLFTALNVVRPKVAQRYNLSEFEFSESYLFFWDQLEKANLFLENIIQTRSKEIDDRKVDWLFRHPIGDGGVWNMMPSLVEKYGVVPKEIMPESHHSENTRMLRTLIRRKLREQGLELRAMANKSTADLRKEKANLLAEIYRLLVVSFGTPPKEFTWRFVPRGDSTIVAKQYTPQAFYQEAVAAHLGDYVMLMNDPTRDYYQLYEIEWDRNRYDSPNWTFVNLPLTEIKTYAKASILHDEAMYFSCDVGTQLDRDRGLLAVNNYDYASLLGVPFEMDREERILSYESGSTHGMALVGVDTLESGATTKWLLENSWGKEAGHQGYLIMTDEWFDGYMFRLVVKKDFLPKKVLQVLEQTPITLPPWDRMY